MAKPVPNLNAYYNNLKNIDSILYPYQFAVQFEGGSTGEAPWLANLNSWQAKNEDAGVGKEYLSYLVQSANVPDKTLSTGSTSFLGTEFRNPGVIQFGHSWAVNMLLLEDFAPYEAFRRWQHGMSDLSTSGGGIRKIQSVAARLSILDSSSQTQIRSFVLDGIWPSQVGQLSLQYTSGGGGIANFSVTFQYQFWYRDDDFTNANPLNY